VQPGLVLLSAIGISSAISLATLVMAVSTMREGRRVSKTLEEILVQSEYDLQRARWAEMDSQKEVRTLKEQLEEQRPDRLFGKLEHATGKLEQL
jgi:hypothetical protein